MRQPFRITRPVLLQAIAVSAIGLGLPGCGVFGGNDELNRLDEERDLWVSHNIDDYQITIRRECFCSSITPVIVTVVDGQVASRRYTDSGVPVPAQDATFYPDVPGLFAIAEDARRRADKVSITFHPTYGFPESMVIDWVNRAIDDEVTYSVTAFTR